MPSIHIQAPTDRVFGAMSDLTRHARWAAHDLEIKALGEGPAQVGSQYSCTHKGKPADQVTITDISPNERFGFHVTMPNKWELQWNMTATSQGEGTLVTRDGKITKMPLLMTPMKLLVALIGSGYEKKLLNNMKADLEGGSG